MVYGPSERREEEEYDHEIRQAEGDANRLRAEIRQLNIELGECHQSALGLMADYEPKLVQALAEVKELRRLLHDVRQTVNPLAAYPWLVDKIEAVFTDTAQ